MYYMFKLIYLKFAKIYAGTINSRSQFELGSPHDKLSMIKKVTTPRLRIANPLNRLALTLLSFAHVMY